jgi:hypothetical protein
LAFYVVKASGACFSQSLSKNDLSMEVTRGQRADDKIKVLDRFKYLNQSSLASLKKCVMVGSPREVGWMMARGCNLLLAVACVSEETIARPPELGRCVSALSPVA